MYIETSSVCLLGINLNVQQRLLTERSEERSALYLSDYLYVHTAIITAKHVSRFFTRILSARTSEIVELLSFYNCFIGHHICF